MQRAVHVSKYWKKTCALGRVLGTQLPGPALTLFPAQDGEWVAWTPEGYFVASARGIRLIGASINQGLDKAAVYISGEQLRERFYRPELIQARLHVEPQTSPQNTVQLRPNP